MSSTQGVPPGASSQIAIVGMSCRLPGGISTLDDFWTLLSRSRDGWCKIPEDRYSTSAYYHPNPQKRGCFNQQSGYFLQHDISKFDAPFFHITKQEAEAMDPQQRQLLECTYEAMENAGLPKDKVAGSKMGVFTGGTSSDYRFGTLRDLNRIPVFDATGNHQSIQAGRISYSFDLRGPCCSIDTACSSGLYALHAAIQSIRSGESSSAIVAAAALHLEPEDMISMSMLGIFNEHGKTFAFDHRAKSGFARGEGIGCLILKPLDRAIQDNDNIYSVIVGSGTNQDGSTIGLSTPNGEAQEQLIREVYARANISPQDTGFIEAHGTGTKVGDPIEAGALYRVFGAARTKRFPIYLGSVKTNVGHLENASGIISIIKASLILQKGFILPNVNFEKANSEIPLDKWNMKVPLNIRPWPKDKRFISVNNFGFGGSNAHCVLERRAFHLHEFTQGSRQEFPRLVVFSANDESAATRTGSELGVYIEQHPQVFQKRLMDDMVYTLGERRTHLPWRSAIVATSCNELASLLNGVDALPRRALIAPNIAFVFTGQGAQWPQMGTQLMDSHPVFSETVRAASDYLKRIGADFDLVNELVKPKGDSDVGKAHISQPICTAIQLGLIALLTSWGIKPSSVVGHSSGEIAAAYATGAITLENAMAVAYYRGQVAFSMTSKHPDVKGAMIAVGTSPDEVKSMISQLGLSNIVVACENSPNSVTASGDAGSVEQLSVELTRRSIFNRKLYVDVAYHSPHMQLLAESYMASIKDLPSQEATGAVFYSSLFGEKLMPNNALGASYWVDNLTKPVLFSSAFKLLVEDTKPDVVVEIGPHSALEGPIKQILKAISVQRASKVRYLPSLVRNQHGTASALKLAGSLFILGQLIDFGAVNQTHAELQRPNLITDFAPYPWSHQQYWFESRSDKQHRLKPFPRHDLLGLLEDTYSVADPNWQNSITTDDVPWLRGHQMQSLTTFPLAGYIAMAVEAESQLTQLRGIQLNEVSGFRLREIQVSTAFILDEGSQYETLVTLRAYADGTRSYSKDWDEFRVSSWASDRGWIEHCRGLVGVQKQRSPNPVSRAQLHAAHTRRQYISADNGTSPLSMESFYRELREHGCGYSAAFQMPESSTPLVQGDFCGGIVSVPDTATSMPYSYEEPSIISTAFVDLLIQFTFMILGAGRSKLPCLYLPSAVKEIEISKNFPREINKQVQVVANGCSQPGPVDFYVDAWHHGLDDPVIRVSGLKMTPLKSELETFNTPRRLCFAIEWQPQDCHVDTETDVSASRYLSSSSSDVFVSPNNVTVDSGVLEEGISTLSEVYPDKAHSTGYSEIEYPEQDPGIPSKQPSRVATPVDEDEQAGNTFAIITERKASDSLVSALSSLLDMYCHTKPVVLSWETLEPSATVDYVCLSELDKPLLYNMTPATFEKMQKLLLTCHSILWVNRGGFRFAEKPENNIVQGLFRTVRSENEKAAATLDLDPKSLLAPSKQAVLIVQALEASLATPSYGQPVDFEFAEENGQLVVPRVVEQEDINLAIFRETNPSAAPYLQDFGQPRRRLKLNVGTYGALNSLYWSDDAEPCLGDGEIEIKVHATGMNFKDVVIAMGQVASPYLGIECSGTVARLGPNVVDLHVGDRVCGMSLGAYSTYAYCPSTSVVRIPDNMSFEVAATIPVVYCTAYYGLFELARLEAGERILIHAAAGGVGQAAIQLAQLCGAEIFTTVGSIEKKKLIVEKFNIPEDHIFYSRDTDFGPAFRLATNGQGADVIINSLAGEFLRESWECLAPFGRFIEIGKRDITSNTRLEMAKFEYNCTFSSVDLTLVAAQRPRILSRVLTAVMDLVVAGKVSAIEPITTIGISEVESGLRKLQSGKTSGKVVVQHLDKDQIKATHAQTGSNSLGGKATYLIVGGTGGLGRSMAKQMIEQGARYIVLLSRQAKVSAEVGELMKMASDVGGSVYVEPCDVADQASVGSLVKRLSQELPPIRGVIHAAMVLKDMLFEKMTFDDYNTVVRAKISGAWNVHKALLGTPLDFFVALSSVAGIVGNRGQAAYAAANTFLDGLVQHRLQQGLPAASLDLTAVDDVGYLAENTARQTQVLKSLSGSTMGESEVLALLKIAIGGSFQTWTSGQYITGLDFSKPSSLPFYATDGKFSRLRSAALDGYGDSGDSDKAVDLPIAVKLHQAGSMETALDVVTGELSQKLGSILMVSAEELAQYNDTTAMTVFGIDSLNAIELRNWIGKELQAHLQVLELLSSGTLRKLAALILSKTRLEGPWSEKE
ncbi:hypothetical protein DV736_g817, partial [Chaetothyriales sp. CBS 134916]